MARAWVVFSHDGIELLRYTLFGEGEGEREETIAFLAYENGIPENDIECDVVIR